MGKILLCRDCNHFKLSGETAKDPFCRWPGNGVKRLGYCEHEIEPPFGRLKNEFNGCENHSGRLLE